MLSVTELFIYNFRTGFNKTYIILKAIYWDAFGVWEFGGIFGKLLVTFVISSMAYPVWSLFEKYVFKDWEFFGFWVMAILVDLFTGVIKHLKLKTFCVNTMVYKFLEKIIVSCAALILFNGISWLMGAEDSQIAVYFNFVGRGMIFFYVGFSAFENMYEITDKQFPPVSWMEKMKKFNETGDKYDLK